MIASPPDLIIQCQENEWEHEAKQNPNFQVLQSFGFSNVGIKVWILYRFGFWCTSKGEIIPLMIKLKDEDGEMQVIRDIMIHSQKKKRYAGIPSTEYDCTLTTNGRNIRVWLIFYQTEGRWVINFR